MTEYYDVNFWRHMFPEVHEIDLKTAWLFGGSKKPFAKTLVNGIDNVITFGRDNVDYSNIESFLKKIEDNPIEFPIPDIIIFNISNNGHVFDVQTQVTSAKIRKLTDIINTTFYFELRLVEWFFHNFKNKRILWLTSFQPYAMYYSEEDNTEDGLILYRMTRALEHQVIFQQNILKHNIDKNNFIMGTCVGNNAPGISNYLNKIILENKMIGGVYGLNDNSPTTHIVNSIRIDTKKL